jgi:hypothetical protein
MAVEQKTILVKYFLNKIYDPVPVAIMEIAGDVVQHLLNFSFN